MSYKYKKLLIFLVVSLAFSCQTSYEEAYQNGLLAEQNGKPEEALANFTKGCARLLHKEYLTSCQKMHQVIIDKINKTSWLPAIVDPQDIKFREEISKNLRIAHGDLGKVIKKEGHPKVHPEVISLMQLLKTSNKQITACLDATKPEPCTKLQQTLNVLLKNQNLAPFYTMDGQAIAVKKKTLKDLSFQNLNTWIQRFAIESLLCRADFREGCKQAAVIHAIVTEGTEKKQKNPLSKSLHALFRDRCATLPKIGKKLPDSLQHLCGILAKSIENSCTKETSNFCNSMVKYGQNIKDLELVAKWRQKLCDFGNGEACFILANRYSKNKDIMPKQLLVIYEKGCQASYKPACQKLENMKESAEIASSWSVPKNLDDVKEHLGKEKPCQLAFLFHPKKNNQNIKRVKCISNYKPKKSQHSGCGYGVYFLESKKFRLLKAGGEYPKAWIKGSTCKDSLEELANLESPKNQGKKIHEDMINLQRFKSGRYFLLYAADELYTHWFMEKINQRQEILAH